MRPQEQAAQLNIKQQKQPWGAANSGPTHCTAAVWAGIHLSVAVGTEVCERQTQEMHQCVHVERSRQTSPLYCTLMCFGCACVSPWSGCMSVTDCADFVLCDGDSEGSSVSGVAGRHLMCTGQDGTWGALLNYLSVYYSSSPPPPFLFCCLWLSGEGSGLSPNALKCKCCNCSSLNVFCILRDYQKLLFEQDYT